MNFSDGLHKKATRTDHSVILSGLLFRVFSSPHAILIFEILSSLNDLKVNKTWKNHHLLYVKNVISLMKNISKIVSIK